MLPNVLSNHEDVKTTNVKNIQAVTFKNGPMRSEWRRVLRRQRSETKMQGNDDDDEDAHGGMEKKLQQAEGTEDSQQIQQHP